MLKILLMQDEILPLCKILLKEPNMTYCNNCFKNCQEYLSTKELLEYLKISRITLNRYRREIDFPEPVKLSSRNFRWKLEDMERYLEK